MLPDFNQYFRDRAQFSSRYLGRFTLHSQQPGSLLVPSGSIVACDPFVEPDRAAFTQRISPGCYPVTLSIMHRHENNDERVALARLQLKDGEVERWELATLPGQDATKLGEDEFYGYPVDAGLGCFMSAEASRLLTQKMDEDENYYEQIMQQMKQVYVHTRDWADWSLNTAGLNTIIFSSGVGDGRYGSYWGYDATGAIICLLTDFGLVDASDDQSL